MAGQNVAQNQWSGAGPLTGFQPGIPSQANPASGFDLKGQLAEMALGMAQGELQKQMNPPALQMNPVQPMGVYGGLSGPISMGRLYGNY